jgi:ABC-2 type transport system ATP-binding protein
MIGRLGRLPAKAAKARADELLSQFSLADAADRGVKTYSGGMRRRLDLAASLVTRPQILFLDEPTTGLDLSSRMVTWDAVLALASDGTTVLLTTQYLDEADHLADRIAVIDQGQVIADGTPAQLKAKVGGERVKLNVAAQSDLGPATQVLARHATQPPAPHPAATRTPEVVRDCDAAGVLHDDLANRPPSLGDVFLTLTGRKSEETPKEGDQS